MSEAYPKTSWVLSSERERRRCDEAILADRTRDLLHAALARHVPGKVVWIYGSIVKPGRLTVERATASWPEEISRQP